MSILNFFPQAAPIVPRRNFIDNPRFKINQRRCGEYTVSGWNTMVMDRWKSSMGSQFTCTLLQNGIRLGANGSIAQTIPKEKADVLLGKALTLSILLESGLYTTTFNMPASYPAANMLAATLNKSPTARLADVNIGPTATSLRLYDGGGETVKGIKLELGEGQTLARTAGENIFVLCDDYDEDVDLLHCQKYFQLYSRASARPSTSIDCRPVMRRDVVPTQGTLTIDGVTCYYNSTEI